MKVYRAVFALMLVVIFTGFSTAIQNPSFENTYTDGTCDRASSWDFEDQSTGYTGEGNLCISSDSTDGSNSYGIGWTGNGNGFEAYIQQDVNLDGGELKVDIIGPSGGNPQRSSHRIDVDGTEIKNCGYVNNNEQTTCTADISGYTGQHTLRLTWEQRSGDNLGNSKKDNIRTTAPANTAPNNPSNPSPGNENGGLGLNPDLEADVSDPDGDSMDVTFYDASDNSQIGTVNDVTSGATAILDSSQHSFGSSTGTSYSWYSVADDGSTTAQSSTWSFTTEGEPQIDEASATPQGGSVVSTSPDLSVDVNHPDERMMDVTFFLNGTAFGSDQQVDGSGTASIQTGSLEADTVYEWSVVVDDRNGYTVDNQASPWSFETDAGNADISIDYGNNTNFGSGTAVLDVVPGHSHASAVDYVRLLDGSGTQIDQVQNVDVDSPVSLLWEGLESDREYEWRAEVEHEGEVVQTDLASFTTLNVGINLTKPVQDAEMYNVYRRTGSSGDSVNFNYGAADYSMIGSGNTLNLVDGSTDLETGRTYCYVVTAENLGGEGPGSSETCTSSDLVLNP